MCNIENPGVAARSQRGLRRAVREGFLEDAGTVGISVTGLTSCAELVGFIGEFMPAGVLKRDTENPRSQWDAKGVDGAGAAGLGLLHFVGDYYDISGINEIRVRSLFLEVRIGGIVVDGVVVAEPIFAPDQ